MLVDTSGLSLTKIMISLYVKGLLKRLILDLTNMAESESQADQPSLPVSDGGYFFHFLLKMPSYVIK